VRLLHTSDWHLGRTLHGEPLLAYQATFLDWLLGQATEHHVHAVIVAGDIYDRAVPPVDAVAVLDRALHGFAAARIPVVLISGNHDSAVRLGFGSRLSEMAGVHLRTSAADIARPVVLADEHGEVAIYGIGYLLPDAVMEDLGAQRSHASVLAAAAGLIRADAAKRGIGRTVVAAHAFVTGAAVCESERDIRVGGIADVPASVFSGASYVALGHLHGQQNVPSGAAGTTIRYSGSPLAFSFSERHHAKSVTLAELDAAGRVSTRLLAAPVPRPLREVRGRLADLLAAEQPPDLAGAWVRAVLTDRVRPAAPMERLRARWPHTLVLDFEPEGGLAGRAAEVRQVARTADPVQICASFVEFAGGGAADAAQLGVLRDVVETVTQAEAAEGSGWQRLGEADPDRELTASGQSAGLLAGRSAGEVAVVADAGGHQVLTGPVVRTEPDDAGEPGDLDKAGSVEDWLDRAERRNDWLVEGGLPFPDFGPAEVADRAGGQRPGNGQRRGKSGAKRGKPAA
jgi:DNA repair protein SbcD/Mre11